MNELRSGCGRRLSAAAATMNTNPNVCMHGGLRRQCEICDLADRLKAAEAEVVRLKALDVEGYKSAYHEGYSDAIADIQRQAAVMRGETVSDA